MKNTTRILSLLLAVLFCFGMLSLTVAAYDDVEDEAWYSGELNEAVSKGCFSYIVGAKFLPDEVVTRAEAAQNIVAMIENAMWMGQMALDINYISDPAEADFSDLGNDANSNIMRTAWAHGLIAGYGDDANTCGPNDAITFEQMCAMLYRYINRYLDTINNLTGGEMAPYINMEIPNGTMRGVTYSTWAESYARWAKHHKIDLLVRNAPDGGEVSYYADGELVEADLTRTMTRADLAAYLSLGCEDNIVQRCFNW